MESSRSLHAGPTPQQAAAANRNHNQQSSVVFGDDKKTESSEETVRHVNQSVSDNDEDDTHTKTGTVLVGQTPQQAAAFNKNKHQHSSIQFGDVEQNVNRKGSTSDEVGQGKPTNLTPQQQAAANKNHNQQSSVVFGDGTDYSNEHHATNRVSNETTNIKNKQRCTYNPITGQEEVKPQQTNYGKNW